MSGNRSHRSTDESRTVPTCAVPIARLVCIILQEGWKYRSHRFAKRDSHRTGGEPLNRHSVGIPAAILSVTACCMSFLLPSMAAAASSPTNLIYLNRGTGNLKSFGIWAVKPNGKDLHQVTRGGSGAVIAPNGRKVFCYCDRGVGVMNPDGSQFRKLGGRTNSDFEKISGTGTIAFVDSENGTGPQDLKVKNFNGSGLRTVYTAPPENLREGVHMEVELNPFLSFSPDGTKVAVEEMERAVPHDCLESSQGFASPACELGYGTTRIVEIGGGSYILGKTAEGPLGDGTPTRFWPPCSLEEVLRTPSGSPFSNRGAPFSEDGSAILVSTGCTYAVGSWYSAMHVLGLNGDLKGTVYPEPPSSDAGLPWPVLSPNGQQIAFSKEGPKGVSVWVMNSDGSKVHRILAPVRADMATAWGSVVPPK